MATNYSKWDKFAAEQSDSDEESSKPIVRTVGDNEKVKIGPAGYEIGGAKSSAPLTTKASKAPVSEEGGEFGLDESKLTLNGAKGDNYYWRQDRQEVIMTVILPSGVRGKDLTITYHVGDKVLSISTPSGDIVSRQLKYGIDTNNMTAVMGDKNKLIVDGEDWEVKTLPFDSSNPQATLEETRMLELSLRKVSPLPGAVFWWRCCFEGEPEIDVTKIAGRPGGASQSELLKEDNFAIAHRIFLKKMKNKKKVEVDLREP